jgi:hypothetical protein
LCGEVLEHVIPLSRGGIDRIDNIVLSCHTCNLRKSNRVVDFYTVTAFVHLARVGESLEWAEDYRRRKTAKKSMTAAEYRAKLQKRVEQLQEDLRKLHKQIEQIQHGINRAKTDRT